MSVLTVTRAVVNGFTSDESQLDTMCQDVETFVNSTKLGGDNFQDGAIESAKLGTMTVDKFASESITYEKLASAVQELCEPVGSLMLYSSTTPPAGYLYCNGSQVSRTVYSSLFSVIGTAFGSGDGSTTFHLPDLRGRFLRGVDGATARDPDASSRTAMNSGGNTGDNVGSVQGDATGQPNTAFGWLVGGAHTHTLSHRLSTGAGADGAHFYGTLPATATSSGNSSSDGSHTHTGATGGDNETRPINVSLAFMVKY